MIKVFDKQCKTIVDKGNYQILPLSLAPNDINEDIEKAIKYYKRYLNIVYIILEDEGNVQFYRENIMKLRQDILSIIREYSIQNSALILSNIGLNTDNFIKDIMYTCGFADIELDSDKDILIFKNDLTSFRSMED